MTPSTQEELDETGIRYNPAGPPLAIALLMSTKFRIALLLVPVVIVTGLLTAFAFSEAVARGEVEPEVSAAGIDLSGLGREDALAVMRAYEAELRAEPATFTVNDVPFTLSPVTVGLDIDEEAIVDAALSVRRDGGFLPRFFDWLTGSTEYPPVDIPVDLNIDETRLDSVFDAWEQGAIAVPPYEGDIRIVDGRIVPEYPRAGEGIDRAAAGALAAAELRKPERSIVALPTKVIEPDVTAEQINGWVEEAGRYIDGPVTLTGTDPDVEMTFTREDLAAALRTELKTNSPATFNVFLDSAALLPIIESYREMIERPPRNAEVVIDEEAKAVTVVPSKDGVRLDAGLVLNAVAEAAVSDTNTGLLPYVVGAEPEVTTEDVAAYGPLGLVSSFTTKHSCCQDRVNNIQLFAETVDGAVVMPGEEFSLNGHVGERTTEKGYLPAGTLISGELVDTVGGGVSQFATTFYNAVFYGCYEDVSHKPHTYYFSRYPEVNEATISWPSLDLVFRNDSDAPVWIKTNYDRTSITVEFYGNNGGRTCERELGDRHSFTSPRTEYRGDPTLDPGVEHEDRKGRGGWTNSVKRIMTFPDGHVEVQEWSWRYSAQSRIIEVHPCMLDDNTDDCPAVPAVVGMSQAEAESAIAAAGYKVSVKTVANDGSHTEGIVASQSPVGGTLKAKGATVTINVYGAPPPPPTTQPPDDGGGGGGGGGEEGG